VQIKDITSTSFGLLIGFLLPGLVAVFALSYWEDSVADAFQTFLTDDSNISLLLLIGLGALTAGLVVSAIRWFLYEVVLDKIPKLYGDEVTEEERQRMSKEDRLEAFRAAVDETYRYHQFFGGLSIAAPAFFVGWLETTNPRPIPNALLIAAFVALEVLLVIAAVSAQRSRRRYVKAILADTTV
jgi:hypothetical protein